MLTLWIVGGVGLLLLLLILFGPIGVRLALTHPYKVSVRVNWIGIPVFSWSLGEKRGHKPHRKKRKGRKSGRHASPIRQGKALISVLRTPGVARLLWDTTRRAIDALELVKGELYLAIGFKNRTGTGLLAGLLGTIGPRFSAGHGKVKIELAPDFQGRVFAADGEVVIRTLPLSWISLGLSLLFSRTAREAWRVWKRESAEAQEQD